MSRIFRNASCTPSSGIFGFKSFHGRQPEDIRGQILVTILGGFFTFRLAFDEPFALGIGEAEQQLLAFFLEGVGNVFEQHPDRPGLEPGYTLGVFNAAGGSVYVVPVRRSQIEPLTAGELLTVRPKAAVALSAFWFAAVRSSDFMELAP